MRRIGLMSLALALTLVAVASDAFGQVDPRLTEIVEEMRAFTEDPEPAFLRQEVTVVVDGQLQEKLLHDV